jgi:hypothetical protein
MTMNQLQGRESHRGDSTLSIQGSIYREILAPGGSLAIKPNELLLLRGRIVEALKV